ncbi:ImcF-related family protein [Candidatus Pantoea floridensis]|uniref:Type VI secretion system protein ImpL n=1 Tax=Candidatus Pantoea floridensis TaxID=1938870 RepID=A0A286BYI9_9GAMM|nr:ImcF-related family protein [Pantoea floridensis]PIF21667.1 type VI secretion system protein ImpL [Enterobacteriaceae bacterium JKS000233]SOD39178.1 type VI secretion system protein ImpL [Pantoea floridensis]
MDKDQKPSVTSPLATAALFFIFVTLFDIVGSGLWWWLSLQLTTEWEQLRPMLLISFLVWIITGSLAVIVVMCWRLWIKRSVTLQPFASLKSTTDSSTQSTLLELCQHLKARYGWLWRRKVRMLLITGDEAAVESLIPGLIHQQWLEGAGVVLIYGASLDAELNTTTVQLLRKLRRSRPLDGIVLVHGSDTALTPQKSDAAMRSLEKIATTLRWRAPAWIWQLGHSDWPQPERENNAVGAVFPAKAQPEDIAQQLESLVTPLRERGLAQVAHNISHDWLLRLSQQLASGESQAWQQRLAPWLDPARRSLLRGLMFSLPEAKPALDSVHPQALSDSALWQGIASDRARGCRTGLPWEQTLAWSLMSLMLLGGVGMLASALFNRHEIVSAADKAEVLVNSTKVDDAQLIALHGLRNDLGQQQHWLEHGAPWYQRFGINHTQQLHDAMLPWYGVAAQRLIHEPARIALEQRLTYLAGLPAASPQRATLAQPGYKQLKAWLMMARPERAEPAFYAQTMATVQPVYPGISTSLWQTLAPDLWAFYAASLPSQPGWRIKPNVSLLSQVRQVLLLQTGQRNAEMTLYQNVLRDVRRNYTDLTLEDMTPGTDMRRLFSSDDIVPGVFTRQAWEGGVRQEIEKAANTRRDEIDWVLSDTRSAVPQEISPEALKARLTQRYFSDFAASWLNFLNGIRLNPAQNIADVTDQLTLMSDVRQSPLIALMNTLAWQGQAGQQREALSDTLINSAKDLLGQKDKPVISQKATGPEGPLDVTFSPLLALTGKNSGSQLMAADSSLTLQTYLTRITRVRLRLQQVAAAPDPQEMLQTLAQTVFQGKSVDLTDTQQYGSLMAASLGEEWSGFGQTMFVQPLTQAWETILQPSAVSLNAQWQRSIVENWRTAFDGRYPFAAGQSDASLPMLAEFIRRDAGRIDSFLSSRLGGVLQKEGSSWVSDAAHSQGLTFNPAFLKAVNQLRELSDILFTDGTQGISFELQGRAAPEVIETQLMLDGQPLRYFNQMATWQAMRWPGDSLKPGTLLTWSGVKSSAQIYGDYPGTWGFIRWLEEGKRERLDRSRWLLSFTTPDKRTLTWVLRTQMRDGPLALLRLRGFTLPTEIFSVDAASASEAMAPRETSTDDFITNMDGAE